MCAFVQLLEELAKERKYNESWIEEGPSLGPKFKELKIRQQALYLTEDRFYLLILLTSLSFLISF